MNFKVTILQSALDGLDQIYRHILSSYSDIKTAANYRDKILRAAKSLDTFPERHPVYTAYQTSLEFRFTVVDKKIIILYQVGPAQLCVYIYHIVDGRRDLQGSL